MPRQGNDSPKPSERVAKALATDQWDAVMDGLVAAHWFRFEHRPGRGPHRVLKMLVGERDIEVVVSPTGRSVRVYVDGNEA
jgi:hypothetical protein